MKRLMKRRQRKSKIKYNFVCEDEYIVGTTDDPCRTSISLWEVYHDQKSKKVSFDINNKSNVYSSEYELVFSDIDDVKLYKYQNKVVTRETFVLLLGCET